jgi:hypothetical protein
MSDASTCLSAGPALTRQENDAENEKDDTDGGEGATPGGPDCEKDYPDDEEGNTHVLSICNGCLFHPV